MKHNTLGEENRYTRWDYENLAATHLNVIKMIRS